jgi:hypothetical protein
MDNAGEQSDVNKLFQLMLLNLVGGACRPIYSDPTREVSKHLAESAVKALELRMKAIMIEQALPISLWVKAYEDAMFIANLYALGRNVNSRDGDAVRPLEEISAGRISRSQINNMLKYFVQFGTPARVSKSKVRGADIQQADRSTLCIAWGRFGDLPQWKDPWTGHIFRSKDYELFTLAKGQNFYDFFHLKHPSPKVVFQEPTINPHDKSILPHELVKQLLSHDVGADQIPTTNPDTILNENGASESLTFDTKVGASENAPIDTLSPSDSAEISLQDINKLREDPSSFVGKTVFKRWII